MDKQILIIYHSQTGNTQQLVDACKLGIEKEQVHLKISTAFNTTLDDVIWADGIILATPENFGTMSGALKDFFDRTYYPAREIAINKPYCLLISCETDGTGTDRQIQTIANGYILRKALDTLIIKQHEINNRKATIIEFGQTFAAGISLGIF